MEYTISITNNTTGETKFVQTNGFVTIVLEKKKLYMSSPDAADKILSGNGIANGVDIPLDLSSGTWESSKDTDTEGTEDIKPKEKDDDNDDAQPKKKKPNKRELRILKQRIMRMGKNH